MAIEKISLSLPSELVSIIDQYVKKISRSAFFKAMAKEWFLRKMEKDAIEISKTRYDDVPTEEAWLIIQNECY